MLIRELRPSDHPAAYALNAANVPAVGEASPERLAWIAAQSSVALAAEIDGVLAGFCLALPPGTAYDSTNYLWFAERYVDFIYLDRIAVDDAFRGRGVGRALYAEVERLSGAEWFTLEVNLRPRNEGSLAFHEQLGFAEVGQRETPYGTLVSLQAKRLH